MGVEKQRAWTSLHEVQAATVEALWAVLARLDAGIPVVQVKATKKPERAQQYPRPDWITHKDSEGVVVVKHVGDALRMMKGDAT